MVLIWVEIGIHDRVQGERDRDRNRGTGGQGGREGQEEGVSTVSNVSLSVYCVLQATSTSNLHDGL